MSAVEPTWGNPVKTLWVEIDSTGGNPVGASNLSVAIPQGMSTTDTQVVINAFCAAVKLMFPQGDVTYSTTWSNSEYIFDSGIPYTP